MSNSSDTADIVEEQGHLDTLYEHLDRLREEASGHLSTTLLEAGGTPGDRSHRDSQAALYTDRLAQYSAVENGLCFGRLAFAGDEVRYIGRIGIFDEENDYEPLLIDWRAPASRPFYLATAAAPETAAGLACSWSDSSAAVSRPSSLDRMAAKTLAAIRGQPVSASRLPNCSAYRLTASSSRCALTAPSSPLGDPKT